MNSQNCTYRFIYLAACFFLALLPALHSRAQESSATNLVIHFHHIANGKPLTLSDPSYQNEFGEKYSIRKLKYYISFPELTGAAAEKSSPADPYFLIDLQKEQTQVRLRAAKGSYSALRFVAGIDSAANCSGAQSGALDPMNDMFWTWNSGYVIFKLEGESDASKADLNRIEHHIGGYKGTNNVSQPVQLNWQQMISVAEGRTTHIHIEVNLDKYWKGISDIRIAELPLCTTSGELARKISANIPGLFSIRSTEQEP